MKTTNVSRYLSLLFALFSLTAQGQTRPNLKVDVAAPVSVTSNIATLNATPYLARKAESRRIGLPVQVTGTNGSTAYQNIGATQTSGRNWRTQTVAPISLTTATQLSIGVPIPESGRKFHIYNISFTTSNDCQVELQIQTNQANTIYNRTGAIVQATALEQRVKVQKDTSGGVVEWSFSADRPLVLKFGERLLAYYSRDRRPNHMVSAIPASTTTVGTNFLLTVEGDEFTNDDNEKAPYKLLCFGDSETGITSDFGQLQTDIWTYHCRNALIEKGRDVQLKVPAIGGTDVSDWHWKIVGTGLLDALEYDIVGISLGMNDCLDPARLSSGGVDGTFKRGYKELIRYLHFRAKAKKGHRIPFVLSQILPTDHTARVANVAAFRNEINQIATELNAEGLEVKVADVSTAFSASDATKYIASEAAAGTRVHPNTAGQRLTLPIWKAAFLTTTFAISSPSSNSP